MDKELVKLAFRLGYQNASMDLAKLAQEAPAAEQKPETAPAASAAKPAGESFKELASALLEKVKAGGKWVGDKSVEAGKWIGNQAKKHSGALAITGGVTTAATLAAYLHQRAKRKKYQQLLEALVAEQEAAARRAAGRRR